MLARMKLIEKPVEDEAHIFTGNIEPQFPGGKWVYEAKELKIGYDGRALLEPVSYTHLDVYQRQV